MRLAQLAHWVSGDFWFWYTPSDNPVIEWCNGYLLTEGELVEMLDKAKTVDYYSEVHMKLVCVYVVDEAIERMKG